MYTTIEADIKDGRIISDDAHQIPSHAHVLITLLSKDSPLNSSIKKYDFEELEGCLTWKGDAVAEQRKLRDEW